jgi:hypothetical protein
MVQAVIGMNGSPAAQRSNLASARSVVLVTGMSGSGKSTVLAELARRGHRVVDTDDPGWLVKIDTADGPEPAWNLDGITAQPGGARCAVRRFRHCWVLIGSVEIAA